MPILYGRETLGEEVVDEETFTIEVKSEIPEKPWYEKYWKETLLAGGIAILIGAIAWTSKS